MDTIRVKSNISPALNDKAKQSWTELRSEFLRSFDESLVISVVKGLLGEAERLERETFASGSHYRCIKLSRPKGQIDLAIKVPLDLNTALENRTRMQCFQVLKAISTPSLLPPLAALTIDEALVYVMPFAAQPPSAAKEEWLPMSERIMDLHKLLNVNGFMLDDIEQIRCWQGVPMLIDLSDIRKTKQGEI